MTFVMMPKLPGSGWKEEKNSSDPPRPALVREKRDGIVFSPLLRAGPHSAPIPKGGLSGHEVGINRL